ncbi:hypothetical protein M5K25_003942 [Dendrobium thyrsiflorum]|uniref:Uncharacterized protein n=1 Tax=Dendrobium thyrsiflorum TaxID=117978 RepID=A0ABD0VSA5_DENTH
MKSERKLEEKHSKRLDFTSRSKKAIKDTTRYFEIQRKQPVKKQQIRAKEVSTCRGGPSGVDDAALLNVRTEADGDLVKVAAENGTVPYGGTIADGDLTGKNHVRGHSHFTRSSGEGVTSENDGDAAATAASAERSRRIGAPPLTRAEPRALRERRVRAAAIYKPIKISGVEVEGGARVQNLLGSI